MNSLQSFKSAATAAIAAGSLSRRKGRITAVQGMVLEASGLDVQLGELVAVIPARGSAAITAEVIGLRDERALLMPHGAVDGLCLASEVESSGRVWSVPVGEPLLGRVIDALGNPLDGRPLPTAGMDTVGRFAAPINPLQRAPITQAMNTGIRALDVFTPIGLGQRLGIFSGSGVGKSTLLGMISKRAAADVIVIALIGERGREVGDFLRDSLGAEGRARAIVIAASSDQPAVLRRQAAYTATAIAEWFRDREKNVLLIMDSITRFALAQREIGLAVGEPMGSRGFPPSCFALLPPLLERAGLITGKGSITGIYTVLVEGDDMNEPVADHMRAILDGHVILNRRLAARGHYPPVDVINSISRLAARLWKPAQKQAAEKLRRMLAIHQDQIDMIELGAYERGANAALDRAIDMKPELDALLRQRADEAIAIDQLWAQTQKLSERAL